MRTIHVLTLALLCAGGSTACGGGGSGGSAPVGGGTVPGGDAVVIQDKDYHMCSYSYLANGGVLPEGVVAWGQISFLTDPDGDPAGLSYASESANGVVELGTTDYTIPGYDLLPDGLFRFLAGPLEFARGGFARDARVGLLANTGAGTAPRIMCMLQMEGAFSTSSLSGEYHVAVYGHRADTRGAALWGTLTFDGAGAVSSSSLASNADGTVDPSLPPVGGSYVVLPAGQLVATIGTDRMAGGLLDGGDFLCATGETTDGIDAQQLMVGFPVGTGLDATVFEGTYWLVGTKDALGGTATTSAVGTATADGAGNLTVVTIENEEGLIGGSEAPTTYTVSPGGSILLGSAPGPVSPGAISPDGRFGFVSGGEAGESPQLFVLVRQ